MAKFIKNDFSKEDILKVLDNIKETVEKADKLLHFSVQVESELGERPNEYNWYIERFPTGVKTLKLFVQWLEPSSQ
jgi:hypothetical protein